MYKRSLYLLGLTLFLGFASTSLRSKNIDKPFENGNFENVRYKYQLFDPEMAPDAIKPLVMRGYKLLLETNQHLPEYVGDTLSCTHCHFSAGNTFGGRENGLPLVGVTHHYPKRLESGKEYTLAERINGCFLRSMNGKPLPLDSENMKAMVAYLEWISSGIPKLPSYPWMGVRHFRTHHTPDPKNGAAIYATHCAMCHGKEGQGQERPLDLSYPPLWGEKSFNDAAGMNKTETFAYFVYENMPYGDPGLTIEEALDVAAFVTQQPRPHFKEN
jgi:thiosulfate dehydrogenase